jgi:hypothetical protein
MSPSDLLRARLAPADPLEAVFVAQAILASEELASLASGRPEAPDPRWLRHYSQAQNVFRRALADLEKLRKASPATTANDGLARAGSAAPVPPRRLPERTTAPTPAETTEAAPVAPPTQLPSSAWPEPRNRRERRQFEALKRAARHRLRHTAAAPPPG